MGVGRKRTKKVRRKEKWEDRGGG
jgi:hypothetical protein